MDKNKKLVLVFGLYSCLLMVFGLIGNDLSASINGIKMIITSPAQLTIDYFLIGSVGGAFINAGLVGLCCTLLFYVSKADLNGLSIMSFILTIGFSFFGINIINIWPIFLGVYLYSLFKKVKFGTQVNMALFGTSLVPLVSEGLCRYPVGASFPVHLMVGIGLGVVAGFCLPILAGHTPNFHKGNTLYNGAMATGFIALIAYSVMFKGLGVEAPTNTQLGESQGMMATGFMVVFCVVSLVLGFVFNGKSMDGLSDLLKKTGFKIDFYSEYGLGLTLMNIGLLGLFATVYFNLIGASMTGATLGSMICFMAIGANGGHVLNVSPIILGYFLATPFRTTELTAQALIVGSCFVGCLCPLTGKYGSVTGIVLGMLHSLIVTSVVGFHGGFCLYNGGFTAGIIAMIITPFVETFFEASDSIQLLPKIKL